jgi:hypothetical protein
MRVKASMKLAIMLLGLRVRFQDRLPVSMPMLEELFQVAEQVLSQGCIETFLAHPLDQGYLLSDVPFALGNVPVDLGKYVASVQ